MKTKLFSLLCTLMCAGNLFAYSFEVNGIYYNKLGGDSVEVTYKTTSYNSYSGSVTIPEVVTYSNTTYRVTTIGEFAFYYCSSLASVTIPHSVTTIGKCAFSFCSGLTLITIPNSVTIIGYNAFSGCSGLTSVTIGNSVTTIGEGAFRYCSGLTSVTIPNSVTTIGKEAFSNCSKLTSVTIGNSVTTIGSSAFYECTGLTSVTIGNSVTTIGEFAFYKCSSLTSITIPNSVTTIGSSAFYKCSGLTSVTIGNSVTTIGKEAFSNCSKLTSVTIGNSVTTIGSYAFASCSKLTSITIPNSVTTIGDYAFEYCSGLTSVTIGNSVTTIGSSAFYSCSKLTSVTIGSSVTTIGSSAFSGCSSLTKTNYTGTIADWCKIKFGSSYANPMYYSHNLYINDVEVKDLVIPEGVESIGDCAFYYCKSLTSVIIGNSVTTIGNSAFYYCSGLKTITCYATNPPTCGSSSCFDYVDKSIPVYVPARSVDAYKQAGGWRDFYNLQGSPNDYAMVTCSATNGTIKGGGKYIKGDTCTLTVIPNYGYQFTQWNDDNTDNPRSFIVTQDTTFIAQLDIAYSGQCGDNLTWKYNDGVLVISGTGAMYDYTQGSAPWMLFFQDSISSLVINNGCTSIGDFAFYGLSNKNFKTIDVPNGVEQIGQFAFANCDYLKTLYLGPSIEGISDSAFANDERLLYITCYAIEPPLLDESAFANYDVYLSVPCESQDEYKVSKGWKLFNKENVSCIGAEEKPITGDEVTVDPSADNATFTWPQNDQAAGYSIEITKDGVVFCTLTFNAQGQLTGIAFAPNRAGSRMLDAAVMTSNGWQFTVTGLDQASKYGYALDALNASKQSIKHYEGEFATDGYTSLEWVTSDHIQGINKMLLDGHLYILRDGNLYTATGARVK